MQEGGCGYACEGVVHAGVLLGCGVGGVYVGEPVGGLAWGKRFCDESKMGDVVSFCCAKSLFHCCFAALCFVLCYFVRCCCGFETFLSPPVLEKYIVFVMSKIVAIVDQTAVKRVVVLRGKR